MTGRSSAGAATAGESTADGSAGAATTGPATGGGAARRRRSSARRRRRVVGWVLLVGGAAVLAACAWVGWRTYRALDHLSKASAEVVRLQAEIGAASGGRPADLAVTVAVLQEHAAAARDNADDPLVRLAGHLPYIGPDLAAVRTVSAAVDDLATTAVPDVVHVAGSIRPADLAPRRGAIDLAPVQQAAPVLQRVDAAVAAAGQRVQGIDRGALIGPVRSAVDRLQAKLDTASRLVADAARLTRLVPAMLGADGPRTYLLVVQNPAEARATGGIFGSVVVLRADTGRITLTTQSAVRSLTVFDPPVAPVPAELQRLYGTAMAVYPADVNLSPDFPTGAALFAAMYQRRTGVRVDGLVAVDPVAISYLLRGAPPVRVAGTDLTSATFVPLVLSTAYATYASDVTQEQRDVFLADATAGAFSAVMSGRASPAAVAAGLVQAITERRLLVWSADPGQQREVAATPLGGTLPDDSDGPAVGVFLNDGTGGKLDYYLDNAVALTPGACRADGRRELQVAITLRYLAPPAALPDYVLGIGNAARELKTNVLVYAPAGGGLAGMSVDGSTVGFARGAAGAREVGQLRVTLRPGSAATVTAVVLLPPTADGTGAPVPPKLVLTPGVRPWTVQPAAPAACHTS